MLFSISSVLLAVASLASTAAAASLQQVTNYGSPAGSAQMFIYVPDNVKPNPAIVVGIHWCSGNAQAFYTGTGWKAQADQYGFIIIYPSTVNSDGCWDVHSTASLTHNGGSDSLAIRTMVSYTIQRYSADASRVYATGHSSGGMMTSVLLGTYPDVFKAGSAFAGVPFACFAGTSSWSSACAQGQITRTPAQWGDLVRAAYPGFTGTRPRVQIWHGTQDDTLNFHNFDEEIKQWTNVFGLSQTPTTTENNPFGYSGWVRTKYGTQFEAIREQGQPHNLIVMADQAAIFFGIPSYTAGPPGSSPTSVPPTSIPSGPSSTVITSPTTVPTGGPTGPGVAKWGQCGGIGYNGPTNCIASTCTPSNAYYSQCL